MSEGNSYIRMMSDIIDSGVWAGLSHAAKTLYPVLLKFSDFHFKPVWPNTETLLGLTGFKTKKSLQEARRELVAKGLLKVFPGNGHKSSRYHFIFAYREYGNIPLGDTMVSGRGREFYPSGESSVLPEGGMGVSPNHINITITNNQKNKLPKAFLKEGKEKKSSKEEEMADLVELYGLDCFTYALEESRRRGLGENYAYIKAICKNHNLSSRPKEESPDRQSSYRENLPKNNHSPSPRPFHEDPSWGGFLSWAESHLSVQTIQELRSIPVEMEGRALVVLKPVSFFLEQIIGKYFTENLKPPVLVVFAEPKEKSRVSVL